MSPSKPASHSPARAQPGHAHGRSTSSSSFERIATWLSAACAVHCLVVPVASALVPLVGVSSHAASLNETFEQALHVFVVAGGLLSLWMGYRRHREGHIAALMAGCIALYFLGHAMEGAWYGVVVSVLSGLGLAAASFWSARRGHLHLDSCEAH